MPKRSDVISVGPVRPTEHCEVPLVLPGKQTTRVGKGGEKKEIARERGGQSKNSRKQQAI